MYQSISRCIFRHVSYGAHLLLSTGGVFMYESIDKKASGSIGRRKYGPAVLPLAIAAAIFLVLYIIVFYGFIYIHKDSFVISPNAGIVSIVLTLISFALLILYAIGIGKSDVLAAAMLTSAARIVMGFVIGIVSNRQNQIKFVPNIYNYISIVILFVFAFAGISLLVNPDKIRMAAGSAIIVLILNVIMLIICVCQSIESCREYMAAIEYLNLNEFFLKSLLNSVISSSLYYLSQILMCLSIVMIPRKFKPITHVPKTQPASE